MRVIFNEEMRQVADDMDRIAGAVSQAIKTSGKALLEPNLDAAQEVIDGDQAIDQLEGSIIDQCVRLLAKQNPVATDLRVIVSTLRLAATFERMGDLSRHIAEAVRRAYPDPPLPPEAHDLFGRMQDFLNQMSDRLVAMLSDRDTKVAEQIIIDDDQLDQLHQQTFDLALSDEWTGSKQQMIDLVLLARFMERIGDHGVSAARRVVYIVSGFDPTKDPKDLEDID
ncbi:phosphate transport system regulatory protein PhoU [Bifidobacterium actinocoloniiforme DSM 22766]|uniref:Phosphate-specific transport system accessory protein PhoU n=1 Tax=Bifidobacterium actinocoloniiforme DSM 22766 TaxID=1437605 RepID=A0A086Z1R1_9BIFI|nr:phosphate signaling complex protein PhoU [Bifidobacterium actinocoloniiforme]AKV55575.1 PhoU family transcriptional regulator [Bifidobacterium actinocoloniiforme DSM 22766]KFI40461.1 phosphate transport system regulatory protein PhoU [Bifidobacterium actinocoloniiforme DSM 22766]